MISFEWLITEDISDLSAYKADGFDIKEDFLYLDGWYSLKINDREWGGIPSCFEYDTGYRPLSRKCPMHSDYSVLELLRGFLKVQDMETEAEYIFQPWDLNLTELVFKRQDDKLSVCERSRENGDADWIEIVSFHEFCDVMNESREKLLDIISRNSPALLNNRYIREL